MIYFKAFCTKIIHTCYKNKYLVCNESRLAGATFITYYSSFFLLEFIHLHEHLKRKYFIYR